MVLLLKQEGVVDKTMAHGEMATMFDALNTQPETRRSDIISYHAKGYVGA